MVILHLVGNKDKKKSVYVEFWGEYFDVELVGSGDVELSTHPKISLYSSILLSCCVTLPLFPLYTWRPWSKACWFNVCN
jgi:NADH:ubiquinone oxidoreductase subunit 4 (subunit M)